MALHHQVTVISHIPQHQGRAGMLGCAPERQQIRHSFLQLRMLIVIDFGGFSLLFLIRKHFAAGHGGG